MELMKLTPTIRFARITLAIIISSLAMGAINRAIGLDGFDGEIANLLFLVAAMLLASLSDRELFWAATPKRRRRRPIV
jgi:hypothetical protein